MDTVKDFFQSIYDNYRDRIKNPLVGSFLLSFFFFNWRYFAILFSSEWPVHCRIEWIDERYTILYNFGCPLLIALFYILGLPYINLVFDKCLNYYSDQKFEKKKRNRKKDLETERDEASLIRDIADAKAGTSEINNLKERNDSLVKELNNAVSQMEEDLKRHNATIQQYQAREKELKEQNKNYVIAELLSNDLNISVSSKEVNTLSEIYNLMTDKGRERYLDAVKMLEMGDYEESLDNLLRYVDLDLVEVDFNNKNKIRTYKVTKLGKLLSTYITNGYNLM
ncbi:hypothetical protein [Flavobacterium sp. F52]|uniref:hypothetical protein n=1 Tax=Flavobacterium sp. F52 TaxID=1202532 RepID=UPI000272DFC5|nr:hypothetical protein [Flavobacterium sp. F52]EJG02269.1 hypothetical protein FF52_06300 [Flavobacterium sp. F52]